MVKFETDANGDMILKPMTGWELRHVAGMLMLVGIEYVDSQEELDKGLSHTIALVVPPKLALEFAEALKKEANKLLAASPTLH